MSEDLEQLIRRRQDEIRGYPLPLEQPPSIMHRLREKFWDAMDNPAVPLVLFSLAAFSYSIAAVFNFWIMHR